MRAFVIGGLLIGVHILSTTVFQYLRIGGVAPNFMIMIIVAFALLRGSKEGTIIGLCAGVLYDIVFGSLFGLTALTYGIIGYMCGRLNKNCYRENFIMPFACTLASSVFSSIASIFIFLMRGRTNFTFFLTNRLIPELIYTATLSLVVYQIMYLINEKLEEKEKHTRNIF
ncbi:MAG: rod shape-determining protein MreD [Cellulosilyticaceae bacterium]